MATKAKLQQKSKKSFPLCACGCGGRTKGGTFRMGHDQRLRGVLKRAEAINAQTRAFIAKERGEWLRLLNAGKRSPRAKARRTVQRAVQPKAPRRVSAADTVKVRLLNKAPAVPASQV